MIPIKSVQPSNTSSSNLQTTPSNPGKTNPYSNTQNQTPLSMKKFEQQKQSNNKITSLGRLPGNASKKDFTQDHYMLQRGYSRGLLQAMNQYSAVLDGIKSRKKDQIDPYEDKEHLMELKNVHKTYMVGMEGVAALRGLDLRIYNGELLLIYGKSGGGKSSLLNLIGTIDEPSKGSVYLEGQGFLDCLKDPALSAIRLKQLGFVFQSFNLINSLTALENVKLPMLLCGKISSLAAHKRAVELLDELGLSHRKNAYPRQMSGGEQQRVTIARAIANEPRLLLLDEPTGDLDSLNSLVVLGILLKLNITKNITMVMVTHDENLKDLANRIVYMLDGKISKCVVNPKMRRKRAVEKLLKEAEEAKKKLKEVGKERDDLDMKVKKSFRNPTHHPFFRHLAQKHLY